MTKARNSSLLRALVVDDEPSLRHLVIAALTGEGFVCDSAVDGAEAWDRVRNAGSDSYALVVSDLAMPGRHGHAFVVDLLALPERPVIAILTGLVEPKLAKDLVARGVDDIAFKPINYPAFAAKLRALVNRRKSQPAPIPQASRDGLPRLSQEDLDKHLVALAHIPTISQSAMEVFKLATSENPDVEKVTATLHCDPALVVEILRLANSPFFNPSSKRIGDVGQAVVRVGLKRVGELALTTAAFGALVQERTPFFPLDRLWRKCLAGGICLEIIIERLGDVSHSSELFCSTVLLPIGRVLLASTLTEVYESMLKQCRSSGKTLSEIENEVLPVSVGEIVSKLLASWGIPAEVYRPVFYASQTFDDLASVEKPLRHDIELVKTASFLGELAVGEFEDWDLVDVPPASVWERLQVSSLDEIIRQCGDDLRRLQPLGNEAQRKQTDQTAPMPPDQVVAYKQLSDQTPDGIPYLMAARGIRNLSTAEDIVDGDGIVVVNALDAEASQFTQLRSIPQHRAVILTNRANATRASFYGRVIALPCSFGRLSEISAQTTTKPSRLAAAVPVDTISRVDDGI